MNKETLKRCSACHQLLPANTDYFHRKTKSPDGLRPKCKKCRSIRPGGYLEPAQNGFKRCTKCRDEFPCTAEFFSRRSTTKDGFEAHCKKCTWAKAKPEMNRAKNSRWRHKNPEKAKEAKTRYKKANPQKMRDYYNIRYRERMKDPEKKERIQSYRRQYYQQNRSRLDNRSKQWAKQNPEKVRAYNRTWYRSNPGSAQAATHRRLARKRELSSDFTNKDWQHAIDCFDGRCAVCGRPPGFWHTLAMDHWIPISSPDCPGTVPGNIIPLCHGSDGCNNSKGNKNPEEWLVEKYGKRRASQILQKINSYFDTV